MEGPFCSHNNVIRDTVPALYGAVRDVWFCKDCLKSFLPAPLPEPFVPLNKSLRDAVIEAAKALFAGYTAEDQTPDAWHTDTVLDVRLRRLFATVEALQATEEEL